MIHRNAENQGFFEGIQAQEKNPAGSYILSHMQRNHATADIQQAPETADEFLAGRYCLSTEYRLVHSYS